MLTRVPPPCGSTGIWLYVNRRWLSPADPADLHTLAARVAALRSAFVEFAGAGLDAFVRGLPRAAAAAAAAASSEKFRRVREVDVVAWGGTLRLYSVRLCAAPVPAS